MNMRNAEKGDYEYDKLFLVFFSKYFTIHDRYQTENRIDLYFQVPSKLIGVVLVGQLGKEQVN
jgi:hypothetical protein